MAENSTSRNKFLIILIVFFMEFLSILVLLPNTYLENQMKKERMMIINRFDDDTILWLAEYTETQHNKIIYESGFYDVLHHAFIPSEKEKENSGTLARMGEKFFTWADQRVNAVVSLAYQYIARIGLFILWLKPFVILCTLFIISGILKRKIKQYNFELVSTVRQTYAMRLMVGSSLIIIFGFFLPIPIEPYFVPLMLALFAVSLGVMIANTQKRI